MNKDSKRMVMMRKERETARGEKENEVEEVDTKKQTMGKKENSMGVSVSIQRCIPCSKIFFSRDSCKGCRCCYSYYCAVDREAIECMALPTDNDRSFLFYFFYFSILMKWMCGFTYKKRRSWAIMNESCASASCFSCLLVFPLSPASVSVTLFFLPCFLPLHGLYSIGLLLVVIHSCRYIFPAHLFFFVYKRLSMKHYSLTFVFFTSFTFVSLLSFSYFLFLLPIPFCLILLLPLTLLFFPSSVIISNCFCGASPYRPVPFSPSLYSLTFPLSSCCTLPCLHTKRQYFFSRLSSFLPFPFLTFACLPESSLALLYAR